MSLRIVVTLALVAACKDKAPPAPTAPNPATAPRPTDAAPTDAAIDATAAVAPAGDAAPILLAATTSSKLTIYELAGTALRERSSIELAQPMISAWPRADGPLWVSINVGTELGRVDAGGYRRSKLPGSGELLNAVTAATGSVWIERCLKWGDNPDEEGCTTSRFFQLPPGRGAANRTPEIPATPSEAPPAGIKLTARKVDDVYDTYQLDCTDASGTRTIVPRDGDAANEKPTWHWLSTTPPIAVVHITWTGSGEGVPNPSPHLLHGCTLSDVTGVAIGPHVWAAGRHDNRGESQWTIYRGGAKVVEIDASQLVFAGGAPFLVSLR